MTEYLVDIVLFLIFALITLIYSKRGFVKTVLDSVSWLVAIVLAKIFSTPLYEFLNAKTSIFQSTDKHIGETGTVVILFFVIFVVLKRLIKLIDKVFKLPVLKQVNTLLGIAVGMICAAVATIILCMLLQLSSKVVYNSEYINALANSRILKFIINSEQSLDLFGKIKNSI